jgi:hypothetical protein
MAWYLKIWNLIPLYLKTILKKLPENIISIKWIGRKIATIQISKYMLSLKRELR